MDEQELVDRIERQVPDELDDAYDPLPEAVGEAADIWAFAKLIALGDDFGDGDPQALFVQLHGGTR